MARWKLTEPHYLNVPGTRWEITMTDRATGRPKKNVFNVPLYLHPEAPNDWNHWPNGPRDDGIVIVCHEGKGEASDIIFLGDPTPGMVPLDDEARELTAKFAAKWTPTAGLDDASQAESFQQKLLAGLLDQAAAAQSQIQAAPMAPGFEKLMETMMAMMAQQTQILAAISGKLVDAEFAKQGKALGEEAVVDAEALLEEAEPTAEEIAAAAEAQQAAEAVSQARAEAHARRGRR